MDDELEGIVQRMIDAGEPEEAIASVIREYQPQSQMSAPKATMATAGTAAVALKAPAIMSGVNAVAKGVSRINPVAGSIVGGAVGGGTGAAIGASAPKVAGIVERATAPLKLFAQGGKVMGTPAGPLMRGANVLRGVAGKVSGPMTLASGVYDTFNGIQEAAKQLDDPNLSPIEREVLLRALSGGFAN